MQHHSDENLMMIIIWNNGLQKKPRNVQMHYGNELDGEMFLMVMEILSQWSQLLEAIFVERKLNDYDRYVLLYYYD